LKRVQYKATEMDAPTEGTAELIFRDKDGKETRSVVHKFGDKGVLMAMYNTDAVSTR
jgi:isocitrate dehydrogenase